MVVTAHVSQDTRHYILIQHHWVQSEKIDILTAIRLVKTAQAQPVKLRSDFENILKEAKEFSAAHDLKERDFTERMLRQTKRMPGEDCSDEVEENTKSRYSGETFIFAIDTAVLSIRRRFKTHKETLADFALLDTGKFAGVNGTGDWPSDSFTNVTKNYSLDESKLRAGYKSFIESCKKIQETASGMLWENSTCSENADIKRESSITVLQLIAK